jgi:hypothetical protein
MYAAIRQGKAKSGMAEELAVRVKEGGRSRLSATYPASGLTT